MRTNRSAFRRAVTPAVALAVVVALGLSGVVGSAGAIKVKQLGKTSSTPAPSCPKTPCEAVGSVTGFQTKAEGTNGLFKIRTQGTIVAWAVDMSQPNSDQRNFFGDFYDDRQFGTQPSAGIAIIHNTDKNKYELKRQSPAVKLSSDLGTRAVVTLKKPLKVNKGDIVALTVPTWLPSFAVGQPQGDVWRASRASNACSGRDEIQNGQPQTKVGKTRVYGCKYTTARLLYWAYFVAASKGGGGGGGGGGGNGSSGGGGGGGA